MQNCKLPCDVTGRHYNTPNSDVSLARAPWRLGGGDGSHFRLAEFDEDCFTSVKREVWGEPSCDVKTRTAPLVVAFIFFVDRSTRAIKLIRTKSYLHQNRQYRPLEQIQRQTTQIRSIWKSFCLKNRRQKRNFNSIGNAHLMTRLPMQNTQLIRKGLRKLTKNWKENQRTD